MRPFRGFSLDLQLTSNPSDLPAAFAGLPGAGFRTDGFSNGLALGRFLGDRELRERLASGDLEIVKGTPKDDAIEGTDGDEIILGRRGDDIILAGGGDDIIDAGAGQNTVDGGAGEDTLLLRGDLADYEFDFTPTGVVITGAGGTTLATGIEIVEAGDGTATPLRYTLQLLHASDLEGNADAVENAPNFAAIVDAFDDAFANTLLISSGDNYIPSPFSNAAGTADPDVSALLDMTLEQVYESFFGGDFAGIESAAGRIDISIMNILGFDASALGNHEFDFGQQQLRDIVGEDDAWVGALFPYLSANLVVEEQSILGDILADSILGTADDRTGVIAPAVILEAGGEKIGVIGATTQLLETISSTTGDPDNPDDDVTIADDDGTIGDDMAQLASVLQPVIDDLREQGVNKIILTSHLQQIALEQELASLLDGVDIIIAGGSDTILADQTDRLRAGDAAGGGYPLVTSDASGNPVLIVSTDGQYSYLGRLVVDFDPAGNVIVSSLDPAISGAYATDAEGVIAVTGADSLEAAIAASDKASAVQTLVDTIDGAVLTVSGSNFFGEIEVDLNGERSPGVRTEETNLGNLTADANLWVANQLADEPVLVSLKNGGGIRAGIDLGDGLVSELEIQQVLAFNNDLSLITLTPEQLLAVLNHGVGASSYDADGNPTNAQGRFPQIGGVEFSFDPTLAAGERVLDVVIKDVEVAGIVQDVKLVEDGAVTVEGASLFSGGIRVVTLDFLIAGGDGYPYPAFVAADPAFADVERLFEADVIADGAARFTNVGTEQDALAEYIAAFFPVDGVSGGGFDLADTPAAEDTRVVNLAVPGAEDLSLTDLSGEFDVLL